MMILPLIICYSSDVDLRFEIRQGMALALDRDLSVYKFVLGTDLLHLQGQS